MFAKLILESGDFQHFDEFLTAVLDAAGGISAQTKHSLRLLTRQAWKAWNE